MRVAPASQFREASQAGRFARLSGAFRLAGTDETPSGPIVPTAHEVTGGSATAGSGAFTDYAAGDLLIAHVAATTTTDITIPAGWTPVEAERDEQSATSIVCWRIAATNGADALGDWGTGRPRYMRVRGVHPTAPIRQASFAATASGTANVAYPALATPLSGNSIVLVATHLRATTTDLAPGTRPDTTSLYARLGSGGLHGAIAVSTARPALGIWDAATVATTTEASAGGAHSWAIEIEGVPGSEPPAESYDVAVSSRAAALAAAAAAPADLGRDYVIQLAAGDYGYMTPPAGFSKGTTTIVFRSAPGTRALFRGVNLTDVTGVALEHLDIIGDTLDAFSFPAGSATSSRGVIATRSIRCRVWGCLVEDMAIGIEGNGSTDIVLGWNTIRSFAVDGIRLYALTGYPVTRPHVHHNVVTPNATTPKWPDLSTLGLHYALPRTCAMDPRRSDQRGYGNADSYVQPVSGAPILVTEDTKLGRHGDCIQGAGQWIDALIEDNDLSTDNLYCHGIFMDDGPDGLAADSTGVIIRRNRITSAHVNAICVEGWDSSCRIEDCLIRQWPTRTWALGMPGGLPDEPDVMLPSISVRKNDPTPVRIDNTVVPAEVSTYWMQAALITGAGLVYSNTAEPVGWASTNVAQGRVGHQGEEVGEEPEAMEITNAILTSGRSGEMVAPEGIIFTPDFDIIGAHFGMTAPSGDYDSRMHSLRYSWSFGDPGDFTAPENILPAWKNANAAIGFRAAHVFRTPGTYTVRLDVAGYVGGEIVRAYSTRTVTIGDPASIFAAARTYFVSPSSDWSRAPSGSQHVASLDDAAGWANEDGASGPYRIMLNRNETHSFSGRRFGFNTEAGSTLHVVAGPGSGADPVLICTGGFSVGANNDATFANKTVVFQGLDMVGPYDPVTPSDPDVTSSFSFWGPYSPQQILVDRCEMRGFGHGVYIGDNIPRHIYIHDSVIEGYGQWGLIGSHYTGLNVLGCRIQSNEGAPIDNGFDMGGTMRVGGQAASTVVSSCDFYCRQGWSGMGGGYIAVQPCIRLETEGTSGAEYCVTQSSFEGGFSMLTISRGDDPSVIVNAVLDSLYFLGGYQTSNIVGVSCGGVTLRDTVAVIPSTVQRLGPGLGAFFSMDVSGGGSGVLDAPMQAYGNTIVNFTSDEIAVVSNAPGYSAVTVAGTISHQPALTPPQPSAVPLVTAPPMWAPREIGYRSTTVPLMTDTATPAGAAAPYTPVP